MDFTPEFIHSNYHKKQPKNMEGTYMEIDNILDALAMDGVEEIVQYGASYLRVCSCASLGIYFEIIFINYKLIFVFH